MLSESDIHIVEGCFEELADLPMDERLLALDELSSERKLTDKQYGFLLQLINNSDTSELLIGQADRYISEVRADPEELQAEHIGQQIGPYKIVKSIGHGGMGQVFLARRNDGVFDQEVALKLSYQHIDEAVQQRFENERQILAQLNHPNIAHLLDGGTSSDKRPYLVMEYVKGKTIAAYCQDHKLRLKERIALIIQASRAVSFAHNQLILHRDLKPENILVNDSGDVKLIDFGIAKLINEDHFSQTATQIMTRQYASPEQIRGLPVTAQSDLFSLGVIAYEIITGYHPFPHNGDYFESEQSRLSGKILKVNQRDTEKYKPISSLDDIPASRIQGDLENVLRKSLFSEAHERYETVGAFAQDLQNIIDNRPVMARKPHMLYGVYKWSQRHRTSAVAIVLTFVILIASTLFSLDKAQEANQQRQIAEHEKQTALAEAVRANKISEFLQNIFKNASPHVAQSQLSAYDLLKEGVKTIDTDLADDPANKYKILQLFMNVFNTTSEYAEVLNIVDQYYQECIDQFSQSNVHCQNFLISAALAFFNMEQYEKALEYLDKGINIAEGEQPVNKHLLGRFYRSKFSPLINLKRPEEALETTSAGLQYMRESGLSYDELVGSINDMAYVAIHNGYYDLADEYIDQMQSEITAQNTVNFLDLAKALNMRGYSYLIQHQYATAAFYREQAVDILNTHFDEPFEIKALIEYTLALTWVYAGNIDMALKRGQDAYDTYYAISDGQHPRLNNAILFLTNLHFELGQTQQALTLLEQVDADNLNDRTCDLPRANVFLANYQNQPEKAMQYVKQYESCSENITFNEALEIYSPFLRLYTAIVIRNESDIAIYKEQVEDYWEHKPNEYPILKQFYQKLIQLH